MSNSSGYASRIVMGANGNIDFSVYKNGTSGDTVAGTGTALLIANNGNIGIGTSTPDAKLTVDGSIHAKSVLINLTGWPDDVFEKITNFHP